MPGLFDEAELLDRADGDREFIAETVEMLAADGRAQCAEIVAAIEAGDAAAVGAKAHAVKGMVSNFCAPTVQEAAFRLERMGKSGDLSAASESAVRLGELLEALIGELEAFVKVEG